MTEMTIGNVSRRTRRGAWIAVATGALTAIVASVAPAAAWTEQDRNQPAARTHARAPAYPSGPYGSARRQYRSGPYARDTERYDNNAYNDSAPANTPPKPHKDFQDYH